MDALIGCTEEARAKTEAEAESVADGALGKHCMDALSGTLKSSGRSQWMH